MFASIDTDDVRDLRLRDDLMAAELRGVHAVGGGDMDARLTRMEASARSVALGAARRDPAPRGADRRDRPPRGAARI